MTPAKGQGATAIQVRRATLDDLEAGLALLNDPRSIHRQTACRHAAIPEAPDELYDRLQEDENLALVEVASDTLVGFASWQVYERHVHLNLMTIAGDRQRQGLGVKLFRAFLDTAREDGAQSLTLRAFADSTWALTFYERQGLRRLLTRADWPKTEGGLRRYLQLATEAGQWPSDDKVLFFGTL